MQFSTWPVCYEDEARTHLMQCAPAEAEFYGVYALVDERHKHLADCATAAHAVAVVSILNTVYQQLQEVRRNHVKTKNYSAQTAVILWDNVRDEWEVYEPILGDVGRLAQMDKIIALCEPVETCFAMAQAIGYDRPFDFEFVPYFLAEFLGKDNHNLAEIACNATDCRSDVNASELFALGQQVFEALLAVDVDEEKAVIQTGKFLAALTINPPAGQAKVIDINTHQEPTIE